MIAATRRVSSVVRTLRPSDDRVRPRNRPPCEVSDQGRGMRATRGAVKPPARSCSKSHRICQIRPSTKPIAIASEISKTITISKVTACSFPGSTTKLRPQRLPDRFYAAIFAKWSRTVGNARVNRGPRALLALRNCLRLLRSSSELTGWP